MVKDHSNIKEIEYFILWKCKIPMQAVIAACLIKQVYYLMKRVLFYLYTGISSSWVAYLT